MAYDRSAHVRQISRRLKQFPVVAILGPRQIGKTTLARLVADTVTRVTRFDLENPADVARLADPLLALQDLTGLVVLDEIQFWAGDRDSYAGEGRAIPGPHADGRASQNQRTRGLNPRVLPPTSHILPPAARGGSQLLHRGDGEVCAGFPVTSVSHPIG